MRSPLTLLIATIIICVTSTTAFAEVEADHLGFGLIPVVQYGKQKPAITLTPGVDLKGVVVKVTAKSGKKLTLRGGTIRAGRTKKLAIRQGKGVMDYSCQITGRAGREKFGPFTFTFTLKVGSAPRIAIAAKDVNTAGHQITVRVSEPKGKLKLTVIGDDGEEIDEVEQPFAAKPGTPITLKWKQTAKQVLGRFILRAYDTVGFWSGVESVTFVNIPHDDIVFESGKWELKASEIPKLTQPIDRITAELRKVAGVLPMALYVGGYTDTVGKAGDNLELSRKRAKAISAWFAKRGLTIPIYYQGFGETALAVATPDNTDQVKNRRAAYVLSTEPPPASRGFPKRAWVMISNGKRATARGRKRRR
ncbi:MAG: OmpA family protein [Myxococcales bacterium]|nr:OmpA family protein [Myxococcales bacterium]